METTNENNKINENKNELIKLFSKYSFHNEIEILNKDNFTKKDKIILILALNTIHYVSIHEKNEQTES